MTNPLLEVYAQMFGSLEKFECWLTETADFLARQEKIEDQGLPMFQGLAAYHPHDLIDAILTGIDKMGGWPGADGQEGAL